MSCFTEFVCVARTVRAQRAGFGHHLKGCAAALASQDVYSAWGDAEETTLVTSP